MTEKFITIFAWIMAVPTTLAVLHSLLLTIGFCIEVWSGKKNIKLTIPTQFLIPLSIFAACWAWILSR